MSWLPVRLKDEWKFILGISRQEPSPDLKRFAEAKLHSLLKRVSWFLIGLSILSYVSVSVALCWIKWTSTSPQPTKFGFTVQVLIYIFALVFLAVIITLISLRAHIEREIQRDEQTDTTADKVLPRNTFWDAFPFASLVFFLVSVFMLFDIAHGEASETLEKILLKLCLYFVAAIITSIMVLFGAHLVRFEGAVTTLTEKATIASEKAENAASITQSAANDIKKVGESTKTIINKSSDFIESASVIDNHLRETASTTGLEILSLRSDTAYRIEAQKFPEGESIDRYIAARSCQGLMSDDAICLSADHSRLPSKLFPSARNMVSSFLEEIAWDLGERCLVTNSRNYTNFLVGAARGFEELIKNTRKATGANAERAERWRVFYLTHTIISPAHLLNWPEPITAGDKSAMCSLCRIHPFMFDYMTYCRYFAAAGKSTFIHARLVRASGKPIDREIMALSPEKFDDRALSFVLCQNYKLPRYCNPWGIPVWSRLKIEKEANTAYNLELYNRDALPNPKIITETSHTDHPFLFCHVPYLAGGWRVTWEKEAPLALLWPLYLQDTGASYPFEGQAWDAAGKKPDFDALGNNLFGFLLSPETRAGLLAYYSIDDPVVKHKKGLLEKEIDLFQEKIKKTKEIKSNPVSATSLLLHAFEHFAGSRWGFHGRSIPEGPTRALDLWDDVQTAIMMLANVLLAQQDNEGPEKEEKVVDFFEWFADTFHSNRELGLYYLDEDLKKYADGQSIASGWKEEEVRDWKKLVDEEFALIGIIEMPEGNTANEPDLIPEALGKWVEEKTTSIQSIMGLRSSIQVPWKHAEIAWYWPCKQGKAELKRLADFYRVAMEKGKNIATNRS